MGDLNTARSSSAGLGTSTAAIVASGYTGTARTAAVETYDGSTWTETVDINNARYGLSGSGGPGAQTDCIVVAGDDAAVEGETEEFNGVSWTELADLSTARYFQGGSPTGTTALGLVSCGYGGGNLNTTEEWTKPQNVEVITD